MNTKVCSKCSTEKTMDEYYSNKGWCKSCLTVTGLNWTKYRSFVQKNWQLTRKQFTAMPKALRSQRTAIARKYYQAQEFMVGPVSDLPGRKSSRSRGELPQMKPLVPEGWVYIISNPTVYPSVMKIGKTYPNGIRDRLSEARRWGRSNLLHREWFADAVTAEKAVHWMLRDRKVVAHNVGEELFELTFNAALDAVLTVKENMEDGIRKEKEMEKQAVSKLDGLATVL